MTETAHTRGKPPHSFFSCHLFIHFCTIQRSFLSVICSDWPTKHIGITLFLSLFFFLQSQNSTSPSFLWFRWGAREVKAINPLTYFPARSQKSSGPSYKILVSVTDSLPQGDPRKHKGLRENTLLRIPINTILKHQSQVSLQRRQGAMCIVLISLPFTCAPLSTTFSQRFVPSGLSRVRTPLPFLDNFCYFCSLPILFALTKSSKNDDVFSSRSISSQVKIS